MRIAVVLGTVGVLVGCAGDATRPAPIRFLHTFNTQETELFNATMAERGIAVESSLVPFARGQQVISEILRDHRACPDLIRIDATWLPALVAAELLQPVPQGLVALDWTAEAAALAQVAGTWRAVPQSVDGLVVVRDRETAAPKAASVAALVAAARAAKTDARPYPLGVRVDGYWLVPWLRAAGAELVPERPAGAPADGAPGPMLITIGTGDAGGAVTLFAGLFGDLVPPPPPAGSETPDELRRWAKHALAYWVTGPWQLGGLPDRDRIAISALHHAPRGGQLLVVPVCAVRPDEGWRLARELVDLPVAQRFAEAFVTVPTRTSALAAAPPLVHAVAAALREAEPLPRSPLTPLLFDDLNPALAAVVARDATPAEVLAGVKRGWARIAFGDAPAAADPHDLPVPPLSTGDAAPADAAPASPHDGGAP